MGVAGLIACFAAFRVIDAGTTRTWSPTLARGFAIAAIVGVLVATASIAQVLRPLFGDDEATWFPTWEQFWSPRSAWIVIGIGLLSVTGVLLLPNTLIRARAAFSAMGVILILLVQIRPDSFWNAGSTQRWRIVVGDVGTVWICTLIGLVIIVASWVANPSGQ